jgi:hypothetical protein
MLNVCTGSHRRNPPGSTMLEAQDVFSAEDRTILCLRRELSSSRSGRDENVQLVSTLL